MSFITQQQPLQKKSKRILSLCMSMDLALKLLGLTNTILEYPIENWQLYYQV